MMLHLPLFSLHCNNWTKVLGCVHIKLTGAADVDVRGGTVQLLDQQSVGLTWDLLPPPLFNAGCSEWT